MSRSTCAALRDRSAAAFQQLVALVTALAVLAPSFAWAGTPYSLSWERTAFSGSCERAYLVGHQFFRVNDTPLTTVEVPEALVDLPDGSEMNRSETEFDSVLLRIGTNGFHFGVHHAAGNDWCSDTREVVNLVSAPLGLNKPLFDVRRRGAKFSGDTRITLGLAEINPPLARDIAILEATTAELRKALVRNAARIAGLRERMDLLQQLDTELHDLVTRPLDEISRTDLDAILDRYQDVVDAETRAAMEQLVDDLKQSVRDLEGELGRLIDEFGAQADEVADLATQTARDEGWDPDDPQAYALGESDVPWVEVPDIAEVPGAFEAGRDPYAAYADAVIAALEEDVSGGVVVARADFVATVRAWRANSVALEIALRDRMGVSIAETNAFLNAQNRVTAYVRRFMDASDWFIDTPVPPDLRAQVDLVLKPRFEALADQIKDSLNQWTGEALDLEQTQLYQTISAFAAAVSTVGEGFVAYGEVLQTIVHATTRIGVGFVPVVGPALDLCEAVTGKAFCLPSGQELSDEERIFSGVGFGLGAVGPMWRAVSAAGGLTPGAVRVARTIAEIEDPVWAALRANRRNWYKTLRGAVTSMPLDAMEKKAAKFMLDDGRALIGVGDDGVRRVLDIPKESPPNTTLGRAPDFLTVTKGNKLALTEVKDIDRATGKVDVDYALTQLQNAMKKLSKEGLAGDVERIEFIIPKGAPLKNENKVVKDGYLVDALTGARIKLEGFRNLVMVIQL
ncbi:hypothetical protein WMF31_03895 [Sorangium sp. So ce1036]|uniref:hypothetical protein n=1 Tax=Sorangium sp. So ce1036 TaxID=3133328 RepID=UPI003F0F7510